MSAPAVMDRVRAHLVALKMPQALSALDPQMRRLEAAECSALEFLETLLAEERAMRETRRIKMSLMTARLTAIKTLATFDFAFQPGLDRNRILAEEVKNGDGDLDSREVHIEEACLKALALYEAT